jgi:hypothetical protein
MTPAARNGAVTALRWILGIIVAQQSVMTAIGAFPEIHGSGHAAVHAWVRLILGSVEAFAAILFLLPPTLLVGGWLLIAVFTVAILFHLLQGEFNGALLIYGAATVVCMEEFRRLRSGRNND